MDLKKKRCVFILAQRGFRDEEAIESKKVLESYGCRTVIANINGNECVGMLGTRIEPGQMIKDITINEYDAFIFVGGSGSTAYWTDKIALNIVKEAYLKGKIIAGICLGVGTLAHAGIIKGKNMTGWKDTKEIIEKNGGIYTGKPLEVSGRIITALGPKESKQFGEAIAKALETKTYEN